MKKVLSLLLLSRAFVAHDDNNGIILIILVHSTLINNQNIINSEQQRYMDLNNLVFPCPPPSYNHESMNAGTFTLNERGGGGRRGRGHDMNAVKMLYIPNQFDLFETKTVEVAASRSLNFRVQK